MKVSPAVRHPMDPRAVFVLVLSVWSAIPLMLGQYGPESLESTLPSYVVTIWGILLGVGATVTLVGMGFKSLAGVLLEQVGCVTVGAASLFYATVLVVSNDGLIPAAALITGWGLSCMWRWVQLQVLIRTVREWESDQ